MKRHLLIIVVFLLGGAVVNVAVAWGCVILTEPPMPLWNTDTDEPQWPRNVPAHWPPVRNDLEGSAFGFHVHRSGAHRIGYRDDKGVAHNESYLIDVYRVGWPSVALQWDSWIEMDLSVGSSSTNRPVGLKPPDFLISGPNNQWKRLPIRPATWLGLSSNTLFYATLLWPLLYAPLALRRFLRVRRGLCPKCAYPIRESSVCTECGCGLPKRARTT